MRRLALILACLLAVAAPSFRGLRAAESGEGAIEMTTYYVGFLYRGPKWTPERTPETDRIQESEIHPWFSAKGIRVEAIPVKKGT